MVRIISDTSTLYSSQQAEQAGFSITPLSVHIADRSYREIDEISSEEFVSIIRQGHMPTSSQPSIGEICETYNRFPNDEILNITMADGLSGTYAGAVSAKNLCEKPERITVLNSRTLCGPHRYLVENAVYLSSMGKSMREIMESTATLIKTEKSFLIPSDFAYLRRGGRLSPLVSYVGQAANLAPIMTLTEDARQLRSDGVRRGFLHAVKHVVNRLTQHGVGENWRIYVTHADAEGHAVKAIDLLRKSFSSANIELLPLNPAFITHGGPGCVAIQAIHC